jgi:thiosulfate dehydrogenase
MRVFIGFIVGLLTLPLLVYMYFAFGHPPVAVGDNPFPMESRIVKVPLDARISREAPTAAPLQADEANLVAGAKVYQQECASCHGLKGHPSKFGATMYPRTPQLWAPHKGSTVVGVSDDPVGETYWRVKNGVRLTGMPSYQTLLSEDEMWQVSLLLASADKPLPAAAASLVSNPAP